LEHVQQGTVKGNISKIPASSTFIKKVNTFIQEVLGHRYSSHSFRSGLITDMAKSINPKFIKEFIGHSDIKTTIILIKYPLLFLFTKKFHYKRITF
jgi:integrase/recombinase XerD